LKIKQLFEEKTNVPAANIELTNEEGLTLRDTLTMEICQFANGELLKVNYDSNQFTSVQEQEQEKKRMTQPKKSNDKYMTSDKLAVKEANESNKIEYQKFGKTVSCSMDMSIIKQFYNFMKHTNCTVKRMGYVKKTVWEFLFW